MDLDEQQWMALYDVKRSTDGTFTYIRSTYHADRATQAMAARTANELFSLGFDGIEVVNYFDRTHLL